MKILYIEDEPNDALLVQRYARATSHQLTVVNNVQDALTASAAGHPDLILVDVMLNQVRQGYDFVRELRDQGFTCPIIAVTALSLPHDLEECYAAGCNEIVTKPYMINELAEMINRYV